MPISQSFGLVIILVLVTAGPAPAEIQTILGQRMRVEDPLPGVNPSKRRVVVTASERLSPNTLVGDPIAQGATLQVTVKGGTTTAQTFVLPAGPPPTSTGPGWTGSHIPGVGGRYTYIDKNGEASPVIKVALVYKAGGTFKIQAKVHARGNNGPVNVLPGNPTLELGIAIALGSGDTYCVLFGGTAGGYIREDPGKLVKAGRPIAEGCPVPSPECGDGVSNGPSEECDAPDDAACPGQCGAADGFFACLCQNIPRQRVVEHANADLDHGWTGRGHDAGIVEGGGYVADLWDCDGPDGPDTECAVGPSCNLPPHQPCSPAPNATGAAAHADSMCPGAGNFCRKSAVGSTGPHCEIEFSRRCQNDGSCPVAGDRCVTPLHGAPLPLVSGGVSVCVVNTFTEDVVGTTDLATGEGAVRLRRNSATFAGGDTQQPCPVCGGFCSGPAGAFGPGVRSPCTSDAECSSGATCVTESVCSWGPDIDKPCRLHPPSGGPTELFGNPSRDCRMGGALLGTSDILFDPATTGTTSRTANLPCGTPGFASKACAGGTNEHRTCIADSECPGGTCNEQCFCGGGAQRPNACHAACLGGPDDAAPCADDSDCATPGFCHSGDCRLNPADTGSTQEGSCTTGPADGRCSVHTFRSCTSDAGCQSPLCPFCESGETCELSSRQCFVNPTITRAGVPGTPDRTTAATFCLPATASPAWNTIVGLPGPGAITQPTMTFEVGF